MKAKLKLPSPRPERPPTRRSTLVLDTRTMDDLLTRDRARAPLAHSWFAEDPQEAAIDDYIRRRREVFVRFAAAFGMTALVFSLLAVVAPGV